MSKYDLKYTGIMVLLGLLIFLSVLLKETILYYATCFFNYEYLILIVGALSAMIDITHTLKYRSFGLSHSMSFAQFKKSFEFVTSFIGNPITLVSSVALAKGLFFHWTGEQAFFPFFQNLELIFIAIVTSYLLVTSVLELKKHLMEIVLNPLSKEIVPVANPEQNIQKQ